ncbi:hypothetical protein HAX54_020640 [Datura stramonium]|uniref:Uncharacterized protein n=1 Tax=Datura stramonium TaxID=4076 RepID=A0ABS8S2T1_DATST|nr:hypothetical protein [Datura stramonium]
MSKKNDLGRRKRQHEFNLRRKKKEKLDKKLQAKKNKMKVDGKDKKKKGGSGFQVEKQQAKEPQYVRRGLATRQKLRVILHLLGGFVVEQAFHCCRARWEAATFTGFDVATTTFDA